MFEGGPYGIVSAVIFSGLGIPVCGVLCVSEPSPGPSAFDRWGPFLLKSGRVAVSFPGVPGMFIVVSDFVLTVEGYGIAGFVFCVGGACFFVAGLVYGQFSEGLDGTFLLHDVSTVPDWRRLFLYLLAN